MKHSIRYLDTRVEMKPVAKMSWGSLRPELLAEMNRTSARRDFGKGYPDHPEIRLWSTKAAKAAKNCRSDLATSPETC